MGASPVYAGTCEVRIARLRFHNRQRIAAIPVSRRSPAAGSMSSPACLTPGAPLVAALVTTPVGGCAAQQRLIVAGEPRRRLLGQLVPVRFCHHAGANLMLGLSGLS